MVKSYVCKTKQASWNETSMKEAILALRTNKMGLRKAARTFDEPKDSYVQMFLCSYVRERVEVVE